MAGAICSLRGTRISRPAGTACLLLTLWLTGCAAPSQQYIVYFPERSANLDGPARAVIADAARQAQQDPNAPVYVLGYTDSAGSPQADIVLSQNRAQSVADALAADGVAVPRIVKQGRGPTGGDPGLASRRVEIKIGAL